MAPGQEGIAVNVVDHRGSKRRVPENGERPQIGRRLHVRTLHKAGRSQRRRHAEQQAPRKAEHDPLRQPRSRQQQSAENCIGDQDVAPVEKHEIHGAEGGQHHQTSRVQADEGAAAPLHAFHEEREAQPEEKREGRQRLFVDQHLQRHVDRPVEGGLKDRQRSGGEELEAAHRMQVHHEHAEQGQGPDGVHGSEARRRATYRMRRRNRAQGRVRGIILHPCALRDRWL